MGKTGSDWIAMLKIPLPPRRSGAVVVGRLWVGALLLLVAGCAASSSADDSDNAKNHGFYGGMAGGWSHP
jgi:hypothetical protein